MYWVLTRKTHLMKESHSCPPMPHKAHANVMKRTRGQNTGFVFHTELIKKIYKYSRSRIIVFNQFFVTVNWLHLQIFLSTKIQASISEYPQRWKFKSSSSNYSRDFFISSFKQFFLLPLLSWHGDLSLHWHQFEQKLDRLTGLKG